jgi:hypothetical protein
VHAIACETLTEYVSKNACSVLQLPLARPAGPLAE